MTPALRVRAATEADMPTVTRIYNEGIRTGTATFETRLRHPDELRGWLGNFNHPVLVAECGREVVGWIAASAYRPRNCYHGVAEFSVYVASAAQRQGVGGALMDAFLVACEAAGLWKLVSRIFPENAASRALCRRHGFREVGVYEKHAQLGGVWHDVVIIERLLEKNLTSS